MIQDIFDAVSSNAITSSFQTLCHQPSSEMSSDSFPATHPAVVSTAPRAPLSIKEIPTRAPEAGEVLVHVQWTASTPLDLHQADGGLLAVHPQMLGDCFSGTVVAVGPHVPQASYASPPKPGEAVLGFTWLPEQKPHQTYVTVPMNLVGRVPSNISMQAAATAPAGIATAIHTITKELGLELPWPIAPGWRPKNHDSAILIWSAASSVGMTVLQVLHHWGYTNILAVASEKHHVELLSMGASACFDYHDNETAQHIAEIAPSVPYIVDCIGSLDNTLQRLTAVAGSGTRVAVMLPVIVRHATTEEPPIYEMDVNKCLTGQWKDGVELVGVRTHFYQDVSTCFTNTSHPMFASVC